MGGGKDDPDHALSDGAQSLFFDQFDELMQQIGVIARAIGRDLSLTLVAQGTEILD